MADTTEDLPEYGQKWWMKEINATEKFLQDEWWAYADKVVNRYLDIRDEGNTQSSSQDSSARKYNIFWANVQIIKSALYATPPKPKVTRQYGDAKDDVARTAALILQRILTFGLHKDTSDMHEAFSLATEDRLIPGLGQIWLRYLPRTEPTPPVIGPDGAEIAPAGLKIVDEEVITEYVHWRDFLWSVSRTWGEVWWLGRRCWMKKKAFTKRFSKELWDEIKTGAETAQTREAKTPKGFTKGRVEVFEIMCEETNKTYWINRHADGVLDIKDDPLQLENFYQCPKPIIATHTTNKFVPRSDYTMVSDQYEELDTLNDRINILTKALRVVGVYDSTQVEVGKILTGGEFNMIAVENWAALSEKGGLKGVVDWFPIDVIAKVLSELREQRVSVVGQIYELTSISDIMRGASNPRDTLGTNKLKAQYSSVRLQLNQQDIGMFVREALRIKTEIICRHFQPETIKRISQIEFTESAPFADEAIALLKNYRDAEYRIEVQEEALSIADYTAEREMRTEYITAIGQFFSQVAQTIQQMPMALPFMLKLIQWVTASFGGASDIETVLDQAIQEATKNPPQPQQEGDGGAGAQAQAQAKIATAQLASQTALAVAKGNATITAQTKQAEIASKERIAQKQADTQVMVAEIKAGTEDKKLYVETTGIQAEMAQTEAEMQHTSEEAAKERGASAMQAAEQRTHESKQAAEQRTAAQRLQDTKPVPKPGAK